MIYKAKDTKKIKWERGGSKGFRHPTKFWEYIYIDIKRLKFPPHRKRLAPSEFKMLTRGR